MGKKILAFFRKPYLFIIFLVLSVIVTVISAVNGVENDITEKNIYGHYYKKLYYGEICPSEKPAPQNKRCIENRALIFDIETKLVEQFPKCKEQLDTYSDALHVEAQLECEEDSASSFRLGAALMLDVMTNE